MPEDSDSLMREGYDFSSGERGKLHKPDATLHLPVYLDDEVLSYIQDRARAKNVEVNQLVNDMLRREMEITESAK